MAVEVGVLGPLRIVAAETQFEIGSRLRRLLVLRLAVEPRAVVTVGALAEALWGEALPDDPVNAVRFHVWKLRSRLPGGCGLVATASGGYRLGDDVRTDVERFEHTIAECHRSSRVDPARAVDGLDLALSVIRGRVFEDAGDAEFAQSEIRRLTEVVVGVQEARLELLIGLGRYREAIPELEALVAEYPFREGLWAALMTGLYAMGRQGDALRRYQQARSTLGRELGIEPTPELQALEEQVLLQQVESTIRVPEGHLGNLPQPVSSFVGRQVEMQEVVSQVAEHRLVTLAGVGGIGKSRLAIEVARRLVGDFPDGVWMVELAGLRRGDDIFGAVMKAMAIGVDSSQWLAADIDQRPARDVVLDHLRERRCLVLLDSCEHLLDDAADFTITLLEASTHVTVLATTRAPLSTPGEHVHWLQVLSLPAEASVDWDTLLTADASRLFVERAEAAGGSISAPATDPTLVATLVRRLDGLPLAIELAAARSHAIPMTDMVNLLDDRFALLAGRRDHDPRHRTMLAAIGWSYGLLAPEAQIVFERLSVFRGSFGAASAAAVVGYPPHTPATVLAVLPELSSQSLVVSDSGTRLRLLDSFRDYGAHKLADRGDRQVCAEHHAAHNEDLAEQALLGRRTGERREWLSMLLDEQANLLGALENAKHLGQERRVVSMVGALAWFWLDTGQITEASRWFHEAQPLLGDASPTQRARALGLGSAIADLTGDLALGAAYQQEALEAAAEDELLHSDLVVEAFERIGDQQGSTIHNWRPLQDALSRYRAAGDTWGEARALLFTAERLSFSDPEKAVAVAHRAQVAFKTIGDEEYAIRCRLEEARARDGTPLRGVCQEAIASLTRLGSTPYIALFYLGDWHRRRKDNETAIRYLTQAFAEAKAANRLFSMITSSGLLSLTERDRGDLTEAIKWALIALDRALQRGSDQMMVWPVEFTAGLLCDLGDPRLGGELIGAAETHRRQANNPMPRFDVDQYQADVAALQQALEPVKYEELRKLGSQMSIPDAARGARNALAVHDTTTPDQRPSLH